MGARLSPVQREDLPEDQRRFHDAVKTIRRRPISGPFITLLHSSPDLAARVARLGHYFHARGQADESILSLRVRTFIALIGARALNGVYEWNAWVGWALEAGVPQETIDAVRERKPPANLPPEDALVLDVCTQLLSAGHRVSDATYQSALAHFGAQGVVELVATLGYFSMIAYPLNAFEIEMSAEQRGMRKPFKPLVIDEPPAQQSASSAAGGYAKNPARSPSARIPRVAKHADLQAIHQHCFDRIIQTRGRVPAPFQVLLNSPDAAERVAEVGEFLLYDSVLSAPVRTFVWLITAREFDCDYEWAMASAGARKAGVADALIQAIGNGQAPAGLSDEQKLLADFCHQLLRGSHHVSDATYRATIGHFGVPAAVQIALTVGYFAMHAFLLNTFEVDPDTEETELLL